MLNNKKTISGFILCMSALTGCSSLPDKLLPVEKPTPLDADFGLSVKRMIDLQKQPTPTLSADIHKRLNNPLYAQ